MTATRLLNLVEYRPQSGVHLTIDERDALVRLVPGLTAHPDPGSTDKYTITTGSTVGSVRIGDLHVELRPKVGAASVLFMLSYEFDPHAWRDHANTLDRDASLTEAVAVLFVRFVRDAIRPGLLHTYQQRDDTLTTIRGRVRIADQIRLRSGLPLPTEVTYDDYTPDVPENQLLRSALEALRYQRLRAAGTAYALAHTASMFTGVSVLGADLRLIPDPHWTRLNERYKPAVHLARLILSNAGIEARTGRHDASAVLIDMNSVFERFVRTALREALGLQAAEFPPPHRIERRYLDTSGGVRLEPDLTWWNDAACLLVGDCKYKRPTGAIPNADVFQMIAYLIEFGLPQGWLIYASGETSDRDLAMPKVSKIMHVRTIDAAHQPDRLLDDVRLLAAEMMISADAYTKL